MLKVLKIELTNQCMRNCEHCSSNATMDPYHLKKLDYENVKKIISEANQFGVEEIIFTGGEPLMYSRLEELISFTADLGMKTTIYSFAYRNNKTLNQYQNLIDSGLHKIIYSLADILSHESEVSTYSREDFFDKVFVNNHARLGFHYVVSKNSIFQLKNILPIVVERFNQKAYFDKASLLRFVPHGKGTSEMDLTKEDLLFLKDLYLKSNCPSRIRLGSPWNILGSEHHPCVIADEIMIIGFDGIAYPCDSVKYFTELGVGGNIREHTLAEIYHSEYFTKIRTLNGEDACSSCKDYPICKSGCIGQKIIMNYTNEEDKTKVLRRCTQARDPKCMR